MPLQELVEILKLINQYSGNPLLVALVVVWLVRRQFISPIQKIKDWLSHYIAIHEEDLFAGGRMERLVKEILEELRKQNQPKRRWW